MNIKIMGNMVSIVSAINFDALAKCTTNEPIFIRDKDGKKIYGVSVAPIGNISKIGATFTYKNAAGFAALNVCIPTELNAEEAKEYVLDNLSAELTMLKAYEEPVNEALNIMGTARAELASEIELG